MRRLTYWILIFGTVSLFACATSPDFEEDSGQKISDNVFQPQPPNGTNNQNVISPQKNMNNMMLMMQQQMQQSMMNQNMFKKGGAGTTGVGGMNMRGAGGAGNQGGTF